MQAQNLNNIILLKQNHIMEYHWGSADPKCLIHRLRKQNKTKYAELWMGTHHKGPSYLQNGQTLLQYLKERNESELPFLLKILCIKKSLSIQIHPNKVDAERLHKARPQIYEDDNQKPEMLLTLTDFECFFGVINQEQLDSLITIEPFSSLKTKNSNKVREIIAELLSIEGEKLKKIIDQLIIDIPKVFPDRIGIINRLQEHFPYDSGILVSCLLKYKIFPPGIVLAIEAGVPHAYLHGECLEIMKNSDNVIRMGLTPRLKQIDTILEIMRDDIGLDGIIVEKTPTGFHWNILHIDVIHVPEKQTDLHIVNNAIGILYEGHLTCLSSGRRFETGDVIFLGKGSYKVAGEGSFYLGSSNSQ